MTTVINLNILNVYGLKTEKHIVRSTQSDPDTSRRRDISVPEHRTIDVTPAKSPVSQYGSALKKVREVPDMIPEHSEVLTCYPEKSGSSIVKAYSSVCFVPKGTNIDSYV